MTRLTTLDILNQVDKYPRPEINPDEYKDIQSRMYQLLAQDQQGTYPVGLIILDVAKEIDSLPANLSRGVTVDHVARTIVGLIGPTLESSIQIAAITKYWHENKTFQVLKGWRDELWPIYDRSGKIVICNIERAAIGLFGANRYGVHLNAYIRGSNGEGIKLWIGRRAADKSTWPGMLDNTAAGGLMTGEDPFECIIREANEEASLPETLMREKGVFVGTVTYVSLTEQAAFGEVGLFDPECQWIYDVELPENIIPVPKDGEVEAFYLWTVDEVLHEIYEGNFKPNCAVVLLDLFIRHGILKENDPHFAEVKSRLRRSLPFPGPQTSFLL